MLYPFSGVHLTKIVYLISLGVTLVSVSSLSTLGFIKRFEIVSPLQFCKPLSKERCEKKRLLKPHGIRVQLGLKALGLSFCLSLCVVNLFQRWTKIVGKFQMYIYWWIR